MKQIVARYFLMSTKYFVFFEIFLVSGQADDFEGCASACTEIQHHIERNLDGLKMKDTAYLTAPSASHDLLSDLYRMQPTAWLPRGWSVWKRQRPRDNLGLWDSLENLGGAAKLAPRRRKGWRVTRLRGAHCIRPSLKEAELCTQDGWAPPTRMH